MVKEPIAWTADMVEALTDTKEALAKAALMAHPSPGAEIARMVDASGCLAAAWSLFLEAGLGQRRYSASGSFWHALPEPSISGTCWMGGHSMPHPCRPGKSPPSIKGFHPPVHYHGQNFSMAQSLPIAATTTGNCVMALFQGWVSRFGVPVVITSECVAQFTSSLWATLCNLLNIKYGQMIKYHPQFSGLVERICHHLKDALGVVGSPRGG
jgi:hypothetical protein